MKKHITDFLNKKDTKWFYDDLYGINIYYIELDTKKQEALLKKIDKYFGDVKIESSKGKMINVKGDYVLITQDKTDYITLTHEIIHIVFDLFDSRGIPISYENDETFAYYYSYLYMNLKN